MGEWKKYHMSWGSGLKVEGQGDLVSKLTMGRTGVTIWPLSLSLLYGLYTY